MQTQILDYQKPTIKDVQYYCRHTKELKSTQVRKALKFVNFDCIKYVGYDLEFNSKYTFIVLPLNTADIWDVNHNGEVLSLKKLPYDVDYNSSDYKIYKNKKGVFECNCQGWQSKSKRGEVGGDGCACSHVLALFYCFKLRMFKGDGNVESA